MRVRTELRDLRFDGDATVLFARLTRGRSDVLLLESADGDGENDSRTFLFIECAARIEARGAEVTLVPLGPQGGEAVSALAASLASRARVSREGDRISLTFPCGGAAPADDRARIGVVSTADALRAACFGWEREGASDEPLRLPGVFAYDHVDRIEALPAATADLHGFPDFVFWLPAVSVVVDRRAGRAALVSHRYGRGAPGGPRDAEAEATARAVVDAMDGCGEDERRPRSAPHRANPVEVDLDDASFEALVLRLKAHIADGDVFQIVPSRTFRAPCPDPEAAYAQLRRINPSPYMFFVRAPSFVLFGASPETCVDVRGTPRMVTIRPIAGTRSRGRAADGAADPELDLRLEADLKLDGKEIAEHMMLVDLARNDVARVSRPGTRRVTRLLDLERCSHVMHLVSAVEGELREELDALHVYAAVSNMGTLVGAPKIEAARLFRRYEPDKRGPYGGAVGYLTSDGELHTAIVIRAALVRDGVAHVRAGAGVVFDSDPRAEAAETRAKAAAVLEAVQRAAGGGR